MTKMMISYIFTPALSHVWQHVKLLDVSLGTRPRYSLVVEKDVNKPTNQTNLYFHNFINEELTAMMDVMTREIDKSHKTWCFMSFPF